MSVPTPNYILKEPHSYSYGPYDTKTLEAGTFVRPMELCYVPKHVKENPKWKGFNAELEVFCFTREGILPVPKDKIRRAE